MPYKISGTLSDGARIIVISESDWSIEMIGDGVAGSYEVGLLVTGKKIVIARRSDGKSQAYGNVDTIDYSPQMVLNIGAEGTYDTTQVREPFVIVDGSTYKMWYNAFDGTNWRIIYCDSTNGTTWSNHQMVIDVGDEGTYDTSHVFSASIIKDDTTYKMWYTGADASNYRIIYCTSTNGTTWTGHQMVVSSDTHADAPCVIKDGSTYKMWYSYYVVSGDHWKINYCDSSDGITWSNHQTALNYGDEGTYDTSSAYSASVIKDETTYKMWYTGNDGSNYRIIYCKSTDGISWSDHQMVVNIGDEGTYDTTRAYSPCVIKDSTTYKMWYAGRDASTLRILYL